jgi:hypothetical protein
MRFAYIDSQGKEVGIPTVEALQLRIELGAIVPGTMFFDASSERWAPAREHEIFRTLQRELNEKSDIAFVAPPPVLGLSQGATDAEPSALAVTEGDSAAPPPAAEEAEPLPPEPPPPAPAAPARGERDLFDVGKLTFTPLDDLVAALPQERGGAPPAGAPTPDGFERTSLSAAGEPVRDVGPLAPRGSDRASDPAAGKAGGPLDPAARSGWIDESPPAAAEGPPGWADEDAGARSEGGLPEGSADLEEPPPPARAASRRASQGGPQGAAELPHAAHPAPRSRARAATRPAARQGPPVALLAGAALLVAALAGAGWLGWSLLRDGSGEAGPRYRAVDIPALPPELEGTFRELAGGALADALVGLSERYRSAGLADEPPADWLAGQYLANASRFPEVAAYWEALAGALASLRTEEEALFRSALEARAAAAPVDAEDRATLVERGVAGFQSALPERDQAYEQLSAVFTAALSLHDFLLRNEDDIDYEPAAGGISRDPVLEAVPASRQLGDEMWRRVDEITSALEAMNALSERPTTERLFSLTLDRVAATPVH